MSTTNNPGSSKQQLTQRLPQHQEAPDGFCDDSDGDKALLNNELRSHRNRGFHDGYDAGKESTMQKAFDDEYERAFEKSFAISALKGIADALRASIYERLTPCSSPEASHLKVGFTGLRQRAFKQISTPSTSNSTLESSTISSFADLEDSSSRADHMVLARAEARHFGTSSHPGKPYQCLEELDGLSFDENMDIKKVKKVLKSICFAMQMYILGHYVEQIGL